MSEVKEKKKTGRPREHDRVKLANDMLEWCRIEGNYNLCGFTEVSGVIPTTILRLVKEDEIFREAYEECKTILGAKREKAVSEGKLHNRAYENNAKTYDKYLRLETRSEKEFESKLKTQESIEINQAIQEKQDNIIRQLESLQEANKLKQLDQENSSKS